MTSTHTSFVAWRAPARSPLAALLQIASTFALALLDSVGTALISDLHVATAAATAAELATPLGVVLADVDAVPVPVDAGVELAVAVELLWLLVEELLLPHPATNTLPMIATINHLDLCLIICPPSIDRQGRPRRLLRPPAGARIQATLHPRTDTRGL
jgi:hypothetical protein